MGGGQETKMLVIGLVFVITQILVLITKVNVGNNCVQGFWTRYVLAKSGIT